MLVCDISALFFVLCVSLVVFTLGWLIHIRTSSFHVKINRLPGPRFYLPFLGNFFEVFGGLDHLLKVFQVTWPERYGEIYRVFVGSHCYVPISSPEILESVFSSQKIIDKGVSYDQLLPWLGRGLLINTGDSWRARRKLLTPAFHFQILNSFIEVFNEQSRILCEIVTETCQSFKDGKGEFNIYPNLTKCSLDIICEATMGTKINAQLEDSEYANAVNRMGKVILEQYQRPWLHNPTIFSYSALGREHDKLLKILHGFTDEVINNRRKYLKQQTEEIDVGESESGLRNRLALLDLLLKASDDGKVLSHMDIRQEIDTFMFEGHDTISTLFGWFLYCMASNPECQENVWLELEGIFGDSERNCTQEDIANLKFLECCIKETLRLYPSVPAFERSVEEDVQLGKYLIPAGCTLGILAQTTHRNPRIFPEPLLFRPERFFPEESIGRHPYAYFPFSAGPRNCIGQRFAMMESKVVLSTLLRFFKFELPSDFNKLPIMSSQITLKSLNGINLVVTRR